MTSVQENPKAGSVRNGATLLEDMKLLGELQCQSGARRTINSELWHTCAGPLVSLPQVGSLAYYFPQGHSEQVAVSTGRPANAHIPNYPNLSSQLLCQVHNLTLHADRDTDEIYAQMTLQPVQPEKEVFTIQDFGLQNKHPSEFFCKTLTASDTSTHGGFSVPRRAAEKLFPPLDYSMQPPSQELVVRDLHDNSWTFRHIYRGQPRRHLLTTGWSLFVGAKRLRAGDSVLFIRDEKSQLLLGVRRANRQQTAMPSSVLSADSMHMGVLAAAAHAAANRSPFTVFYNPRACPSEFVIPLAKHHKAFLGTQVAIGMRFGMMFETEESGKRRYMGTVVGISDLDPIKWPNSRWRNLQVEWDEPGCSERQGRVSLWEIETPEIPFICPAPISGFKRPFLSGFSGTESDLETAMKKSSSWGLERENCDTQYPLVPNFGSEMIKILVNSQSISPSAHLMDASIMQHIRTNELLRTFPSTIPTPFMKELLLQPEEKMGQGFMQENSSLIHLQQHMLPLQGIISRNQISDSCQVCTRFVDSNLEPQAGMLLPEQLAEDYPTEQENLIHQAKHDQRPDVTAIEKVGDHSQRIMSTLLHTGSASQLHLSGKCSEDKLISSPCNPEDIAPQLYQNQSHAIPPLPSVEASNLNSLLPSNYLPLSFLDNGDWISHHSSCQSLASILKSPRSIHGFTKLGTPHLSPSTDTNCESKISSAVNLETVNPTEKLQFPCMPTLSGGQELSSLPEMTYLKLPPGFRDFSEESSYQTEAYSNHQLEVHSSQTCLENFSTVKDIGFQNPSECLFENFSSSQDVQSQVTSASLADSQAFSFQEFPDNSGGTSSSNLEVDENTFLQQGPWQKAPPCLRTYTKVQKLGSVGRSIDVTRYRNYAELKSAIACMFGLEGQLDDPRGSGWKLVYVDYENDVLLVGDDPWEEFVSCVRCIRILSPSEVLQMSQEGMELPTSTTIQGGQQLVP